MRNLFANLVAAVLVALLLSACGRLSHGNHRLIVDLNHTAQGSATLTALVSDSVFSISVPQDANGSYVVGTDNLPTGVYQLEVMGRCLPLLVRKGVSQQVCGTMLLWDSLTFSSAETRALVDVDRLRARISALTDSVTRGQDLDNAKVRAAVTDSLAKLRNVFRREAEDLLLRHDTSLVALPILHLHGLFSFSRDAALFHAVLEDLAERHPSVPAVASLVDAAAHAEEVALLRARFHPGADAPFFAFISDEGDTLLLPDLGRKYVALAMLSDSLSARDVMLMSAIVQQHGVVLASGGRASDLSGRTGVAHGRFIHMDETRRLNLLAPVFIMIGPDGRVEHLTLTRE